MQPLNSQKRISNGVNKYLAKFCEKLPELKCDAFLVLNANNVQYLSGFTGGDSFLLVTPKKSFLITDFRYIIQAQEEITDKDIKIIRHKDGLLAQVAEMLNSHKYGRLKRLAFESVFINLASYNELKKLVKKHIRLVPTQGAIESLGAIKTPEEIAKLRVAIKCAADGFNKIRGFIKPGISEKEISNEMDYTMRKYGAEGSAFGTIIAIDERAALPHAPVSDKKVTKDCAVLIDWGARVSGYNSDTTRVLFRGKISPLAKKIYAIVLEAQKRAIAKCRPGAVIKDIDAAARDYITQKGYGKYFGHSLGHGVGRLVHEQPRITSKNKETLKPNMVFTVEPGIYLPGKVGIRIEDMVLVTAHGCEVMTRMLPKELPDMRLR